MVKKFGITLIVFLLLAVSFLALIYFGQERMIYFPRGYYGNSKLFALVDRIPYQSGGCSQTAFLYPAGREGTPDTVWWLFGGNGSTALDWISFLEQAGLPDDHVCVLVEYPGYGQCRGKPCPRSIYDSTAILFETLGKRWGLEQSALAERSKAMGHSLGAAVALHTAARFQLKEVVAVSPFTTMEEMAKRRVGKLSFLLKHPFDNRDSVKRLVRQAIPAKIYIFHGSRDFVIPVAMGRRLAELAGGEHAEFQIGNGMGHNDILYGMRDELVKLLKE